MVAMEPFRDQLNIDTPELVDIEMPLAGVGSRFIAILIDYLIYGAFFTVLILIAVVVIPALHMFSNVSANWAVGIFFLILFLIHWGYFSLFEAFNNGRTPGKQAAKIRVIHQSGRGISFFESLARNLVRFVDWMPSFYALGIVVIFLSKRHQRLGDMVAGTLVVRDRIADPPAASARGAACACAGQIVGKRPRSDRRIFLAAARHGSNHPRRARRPHRFGALREVWARNRAQHEHGNISRGRRASASRAGPHALIPTLCGPPAVLRFSEQANRICASSRPREAPQFLKRIHCLAVKLPGR